MRVVCRGVNVAFVVVAVLSLTVRDAPFTPVAVVEELVSILPDALNPMNEVEFVNDVVLVVAPAVSCVVPAWSNANVLKVVLPPLVFVLDNPVSVVVVFRVVPSHEITVWP